MLLKFFNKYKFDMWLNNIKDKIYDIYHFQKAKKMKTYMKLDGYGIIRY